MAAMAAATDLRQLRVDQVGSLCAPVSLQQAFAQFKQGEAPADELTRAKDDAVRHVIRRQETIGLPVVTDGELRRRNFQESFGASVSGFDVATEDRSMDGVSLAPLTRAEQNFSAPGPPITTRRKVVDRLRLMRNVPPEQYRFSRQVATRPAKVPVRT